MKPLFLRSLSDTCAIPVLQKRTLSDHFDGKRFHNPAGGSKKSFHDLLAWRRTRKPAPWPKSRSDIKMSVPPQQVAPDEMVVTFVGHATFLLQFHGLTMLTDPHWSRHASPVNFLGPQRVHPPAVGFDDLPKIDYVLLSHNHYDHLDLPTLKRLNRRDKPRFIVPLGNGPWLQRSGLEQVVEVDWWQEIVIDTMTRLVFTPARHWSSRGLWDYNRSLWGSYWIRSRAGSLYFGGDTGYGQHFRQIAGHLGPVDLALLPIGSYEPRWFMRDHHMNPAEALLAHRDLKARRSIGMHFGCFQLSDEGIDQPIQDLEAALKEEGMGEKEFVARPAGTLWHVR